MADKVSKKVRSRNMSAIKGKNTKPEMIVRRFLHHKGYRFRLHRKDLPGKPDITLARYKTVIFVHGCFWHQHRNCKNAVMPKTNVAFWQDKLNGNIVRDKKNTLLLQEKGWQVLTIWECEVTSESNMEKLTEKIRNNNEGR
jgi:DNA mismatch endonuclease (patch repair protein)